MPRSERRDDPGSSRLGGPPPLPPSVLRQVSERDPEALRTFFEHYVDSVHGLAYRLVGEALVEDVTQEVFFKVSRAAHRLDPERDPRFWLNAITYNVCREFWRSGAHKLRGLSVSIQDKPELGERLRAAGPHPDEALLAREDERAVQEAILALPEGLRVAVVLHDYQGLGHEEIAAMTGVSHVAARKRYSRALSELAKLLRSNGTR